MKAKTTAIVVSLVIIALASSAIIGATYSWFEDKETVTAKFTPGSIDINVVISDSMAKNYDSVWTPLSEGGTVILGSGAEVSMTTASTNDATAASITFDKAAPGDSVTFKMKITNNSNIKAKWTVDAAGEDSEVYDKNVFNISIECGNADVSEYKELGTDPVEVTVTITINTEITSMPASSLITITAKATQLAATLPTTNP